MTPQIQQLLHSLDARPTLAAYTQAAREVRSQALSLRPARVAFLATFTIDTLLPYYEVEAVRLGFGVVNYLGPFNAIRQELLDPRSGCAMHRPDLVFIAPLLEDVCPPLVQDFLTLSESQIEDFIQQTVNDLVATIRSFREHSSATVVIHNFALASTTLLGIYENAATNTQSAAIGRLNEKLQAEVAALPAVHVLDFNRLCANVGYQAWRHEEMWYTGHAPLSPTTMLALARSQATFTQAILGTPRKCLVLDLDNTLWGGVIGEEGLAGIQLGHTYPGNVYRDVQRAVLQLYRRGVLLTINSKNNEADVDEVFRSHPDMLLKREHFAAVRINWKPKPENMQSLAAELNIGVDSLVFLDDSPTECSQMRQMLPQVITWEAYNADGKPDPFKSLARLNDSQVFDKLSFTEDDRRRGEMYQEQSARRELEQSATSLADFLLSLKMQVEIQAVDDFTFPRLLDLIHKTNQFNLTTRRHNEARLQELASDAKSGLFTIRVVDRFGDNGIVGVAIVQQRDELAEIDSFLLSCRVIGRQVETALLAFLVDWAKARGVEYLQGSFISTAKNAPAANFYAEHGFMQVANTVQETRWLLDLQTVPFDWPDCIGHVGDAITETQASDEDRLLLLMAGVLGVDKTVLTDDASPATIPAWDSLNHLNLVLAIESEFGISLAPQDALAMQSVAQVRAVLTKAPGEATSSSITFTDCLPEQLPEFKQFIARSYGPNYVLGVNDAYFHWQYDVPGDPTKPYRIRVAMVEGRIAGCLGYIPVDVHVAGEKHQGAWLANWMVDPEHRKSGLGPMLAREVSRDFQVTLALGANEDARDILSRMGWRDFGMLQRYVCVLDTNGAKALTDNGELDWPTLPVTKTTPSTATISRVMKATHEHETFWDQLRGTDKRFAGTRRTVEYLNWRYLEHPQFPYRLFETRVNNELQGYAVYRVEQARDLPVRVGRVVEIVAESSVEDTLLAAIRSDALAAEAVALDFFCGSTCYANSLARNGFLPGDDPRAQQIPVLYQPIDRRRAGIHFLAELKHIPAAAMVEEWYITKSDGDQDRPN